MSEKARNYVNKTVLGEPTSTVLGEPTSTKVTQNSKLIFVTWINEQHGLMIRHK